MTDPNAPTVCLHPSHLRRVSPRYTGTFCARCGEWMDSPRPGEDRPTKVEPDDPSGDVL